eukprot:12015768-Alexandrium_andersonii.AAC.1
MARPWSEKQKLSCPAPEKTSKSHGCSRGSVAHGVPARASEPGCLGTPGGADRRAGAGTAAGAPHA